MKRFFIVISLFLTMQISANTEFTAIVQNLHQICAPLIYQAHVIEKKLTPSEEKYKTDVEKTIEHYNKTSEELSVEKKAEIVAAYKNMQNIETLNTILTDLYSNKWATLLIKHLQQMAQDEIVQITIVSQALEAVQANQTFAEYCHEQLQKNQKALTAAGPEAIQKALQMIQNGQTDHESFINRVIVNLLNPPA